MRATRFLLTLLASSFAFMVRSPVQAQIIPDQTLGAESSVVTPAEFTAPEGSGSLIEKTTVEGSLIEGGASRGSSRFHSFSEFTIPDGTAAYFDIPNGTKSIFSRVTGDSRSEIYGTIGITGDSIGADLFFINPNGIVFGENAKLDLDGSFTATTADGIELGTEGLFSAINPSSSRLLSVQPSAFFFSDQNPYAQIESRSGALNNLSGDLQVAEGKTLSFIAGNILLDEANLIAPGGMIEIASIGGSGGIFITDDGSLSTSETIRRGNIKILNSSLIDITSVRDDDAIGKGGEIRLFAGNLTIKDSDIFSDTLGKRDAGNITILANNVSVESSSISSGVFFSTTKGEGNGEFDNIIESEGKGGEIRITADNLSITKGEISTLSDTSGDAGSITLDVRERLESLDGDILANSEFTENGSIKISASLVLLRDDSNIQSFSVNVKRPENRRTGGVGTEDRQKGGSGSGGLISIESNSLIALDDSDIVVLTVDESGNTVGGDLELVRVYSDNLDLFKTTDSLSELATFDRNGKVDFVAGGSISDEPIGSTLNSIANLDAAFANSEVVVATACAARREESEGSFNITGSDRPPESPAETTTSAYTIGTVQPIPSDRAAPTFTTITEPESLYQLADGRVLMSRSCEG